MPRAYPVPMELRDEDKVIGDWLSIRQLGMLGGGLATGIVAGGLIYALVRSFTDGKALGMGIAAVPVVVCFGASAILAFLPAGWMGVLPGPEQAISPDPFEPPMRIDQWLKLWRAFNRKPKVLPFRRDGYVAPAPLYYKVLTAGKERTKK